MVIVIFKTFIRSNLITIRKPKDFIAKIGFSFVFINDLLVISFEIMVFNSFFYKTDYYFYRYSNIIFYVISKFKLEFFI